MANGLYSNSELMETLVVDLNNLLKEIMGGQYIQACCVVTSMTQKIMNLKKTVDDDLKNREQTIETLKEELRMAGHTVTDLKPEEAVAKIGEISKKDGAN